MKFIFPKNYNFRTKVLGFIDYQTAIINGVWGLILYGISNIVFKNIEEKLYFCIALYFPMFLLSVFGFQHESIVTVIKYMYRFMKDKGIYLYRKEKSSNKNKSHFII